MSPPEPIPPKDGWDLSRLIRVGGNWEVLLEKDIGVHYHPHYETIFKRGRGRTQNEALTAAYSAQGFRITRGEASVAS
jgi:hypothetical protein